jgi:NADH oxidase (H2O2-forming)
MTALRERAQEARQAVIIGGGFIGVEFADELARNSTATGHIVEMVPKLLSGAFDNEFSDDASKELERAGVIIHCNRRAVSIDGNTRVESVTLDNGETLAADLVILGIGGKPNIDLAKRPNCFAPKAALSGWILI